jgi:hypothetical protein
MARERAASGPSKVYLIRHAEKLGLPDVPNDAEDPNHAHTGAHLSARGSARAAALAALFTPVTKELAAAIHAEEDGFRVRYERIGYAGMAPRFAPPDFVFAAASTAHSRRPVETVLPLAASLGLAVNHDFADEDGERLAHALRTEPRYRGRIVLICWRHKQLPGLAQALGLGDPPPCPGTVFDRLWLLDYRSAPAAFTDCPQALLFGDSPT